MERNSRRDAVGSNHLPGIRIGKHRPISMEVIDSAAKYSGISKVIRGMPIHLTLILEDHIVVMKYLACLLAGAKDISHPR